MQALLKTTALGSFSGTQHITLKTGFINLSCCVCSSFLPLCKWLPLRHLCSVFHFNEFYHQNIPSIERHLQWGHRTGLALDNQALLAHLFGCKTQFGKSKLVQVCFREKNLWNLKSWEINACGMWFWLLFGQSKWKNAETNEIEKNIQLWVWGKKFFVVSK